MADAAAAGEARSRGLNDRQGWKRIVHARRTEFAAGLKLMAPESSALAPRWRRSYELAAFYLLLALFGLASLSWSLIAALLYVVLPARHGEPLGQKAMMLVCRFYIAAMRASGIIRCDLGALDLLRDQPPLIIASNHPSLLDAILIISRLPNVACAAKAPIWNNLLFGGAARLAGFVRNDSPAKLVRGAVRQLEAGRHFLIFPEGTRSSAVPIGPLKGGVALIAKHAGVPVQTVLLESNSGFLGKGWPLLRAPEFPLTYRARPGLRLHADGAPQSMVRALDGYFRQALGSDEN
jgi:1-acyl-sn-glycerol-3-phosphate acyltransferase